MKAAWYEKNGPAAEVLRVGEMPIPEPGPGEVRVRVVASGLNPTDVKSRAGSRPMGFPRVVPHQDGAGVIDKVGRGVSASRAGERVWLYIVQAACVGDRGRVHGRSRPPGRYSAGEHHVR